jgi:hypothetical protein
MLGKVLLACVDETHYARCTIDPIPTPPAYSVSTPAQIFDALVALRDHELRVYFEKQGVEWFEQVHHYQAVLDLAKRLLFQAANAK